MKKSGPKYTKRRKDNTEQTKEPDKWKLLLLFLMIEVINFLLNFILNYFYFILFMNDNQ